MLCRRLSPINNMASVEIDGSSTELEVRYITNCRNNILVFLQCLCFRLCCCNECYQQDVSVNNILYIYHTFDLSVDLLLKQN